MSWILAIVVWSKALSTVDGYTEQECRAAAEYLLKDRRVGIEAYCFPGPKGGKK